MALLRGHYDPFGALHRDVHRRPAHVTRPVRFLHLELYAQENFTLVHYVAYSTILYSMASCKLLLDYCT